MTKTNFPYVGFLMCMLGLWVGTHYQEPVFGLEIQVGGFIVEGILRFAVWFGP